MLGSLFKGIGTNPTKTGRTVKLGKIRFGSYKPRPGGARVFRAWKKK